MALSEVDGKDGTDLASMKEYEDFIMKRPQKH
jgi:hypothetical protein